MGPKLLFLFGIVVGHGALAAGWIANELPGTRSAMASTCVNAPMSTPNFSQPFEIYAANLPAREYEPGSGQASRP
jgi:hypothetical protein